MRGANGRIPEPPEASQSEGRRSRGGEGRGVADRAGGPHNEHEPARHDEERAASAGASRVAESAQTHEPEPDGQDQHGPIIDIVVA